MLTAIDNVAVTPARFFATSVVAPGFGGVVCGAAVVLGEDSVREIGGHVAVRVWVLIGPVLTLVACHVHVDLAHVIPLLPVVVAAVSCTQQKSTYNCKRLREA
jgi:hypothetical protein